MDKATEKNFEKNSKGLVVYAQPRPVSGGILEEHLVTLRPATALLHREGVRLATVDRGAIDALSDPSPVHRQQQTYVDTWSGRGQFRTGRRANSVQGLIDDFHIPTSCA